MDAGNHQNFPAKQTQIARVMIQRIGANSIKAPVDKSYIPEAEGTTLDGRKTSWVGGKRISDFGCRISAARELLHRLIARREEARGRSDVGIRDEQPFFAVGLVAE